MTLIAISAAPSVDKSAFGASLQKRHGGRVVDDMTPAIVRNYGFQTLYEVPMPLQIEIRERVIREHAKAVDGDGQIFTFSIAELLADWMRWAWSGTPTETWGHVMAVAKHCAKRYTRVHHLTSGPRKAYDGYVWFDAGNSVQQEMLMRLLYRELDLEERVEMTSN